MEFSYDRMNELLVAYPKLSKVILDHVAVVGMTNKNREDYLLNEEIAFSTLLAHGVIVDSSPEATGCPVSDPVVEWSVPMTITDLTALTGSPVVLTGCALHSLDGSPVVLTGCALHSLDGSEARLTDEQLDWKRPGEDTAFWISQTVADETLFRAGIFGRCVPCAPGPGKKLTEIISDHTSDRTFDERTLRTLREVLSACGSEVPPKKCVVECFEDTVSVASESWAFRISGTEPQFAFRIHSNYFAHSQASTPACNKDLRTLSETIRTL